MVLCTKEWFGRLKLSVPSYPPEETGLYKSVALYEIHECLNETVSRIDQAAIVGMTVCCLPCMSYMRRWRMPWKDQAQKEEHRSPPQFSHRHESLVLHDSCRSSLTWHRVRGLAGNGRIKRMKQKVRLRKRELMQAPCQQSRRHGEDPGSRSNVCGLRTCCRRGRGDICGEMPS
jgi:hypothetical protein